MRTPRPRVTVCYVVALVGASALGLAGYKPKPWSPRPLESYTARLTSEKVTIAVDPLYTDSAAAQVFDKKDIVTRGIMPLGIVVFNDNDFPLVVEGDRIELLLEDERIRSVSPVEAVGRLFPKTAKSVLGGPPGIPGTGGSGPSKDAFEDFDHKFFGQKIVAAKANAAGFLYLRVPERRDLSSFLSTATIYIPEVRRQDTGASLIFFEVELKPLFAQRGAR